MGNDLVITDCYGKMLGYFSLLSLSKRHLLFVHCKLENLVPAAVWTEEDPSHTTSMCQEQSCLNHILVDTSPTGTRGLLGCFFCGGDPEEVKEREVAHQFHV